MDLPFKEVILRKFIFKPKKILCAFFSVIFLIYFLFKVSILLLLVLTLEIKFFTVWYKNLDNCQQWSKKFHFFLPKEILIDIQDRAMEIIYIFTA